MGKLSANSRQSYTDGVKHEINGLSLSVYLRTNLAGTLLVSVHPYPVACMLFVQTTSGTERYRQPQKGQRHVG